MANWFEQDALPVYLSLPNQDTNKGTDLAPYLTPLEISRTSGGRKLDYAVFDWNIGLTGQHVENLQTPLDWTREVEVWASVNGVPTPLFWGELTQQDITIDRSERVRVVAQTMPYHFGDICTGWKLRNPIDSEKYTVPDDVAFNPVIEGQLIFNRSVFQEEFDWYLWVDPYSIFTDAAKSASGETDAEEWTLKDAVNSLCKLLNPDEEFIKNFDPNDPDYATLFDDALPIRNVILRRGLYLPEYLDALLLPLGFDWCVSYKLTGGDQIERRIKVFKRGTGTQKTLKIAPIGDEADFSTTNTEQVRVLTDIGRTINKVVVYGACQEREITLELKRAWGASNDSKTAAELDMTDDGSDYNSLPHVWRTFVANEAGDWNGIVPGTSSTTTPLDLSSVFDDFVPRRRKLLPLLRYRSDDNDDAMGVYIEYSDDSGTTWFPLKPNWQGDVRILSREMGITFAGATPPEDLIGIGSDLKIRVTATVVGDKRIIGEAENTTESPNARTHTLHIDAPDRFRDASIVLSGEFASEGPGSAISVNNTDEADDQDAIDDYADLMLNQEISAAMSCDFTLMSLQADYDIGDVLTSVEGRSIDLNRRSTLATPAYPQIVGVKWLPQGATTHLLVDTNEGFV